jgi:hypothetical protein
VPEDDEPTSEPSRLEVPRRRRPILILAIAGALVLAILLGVLIAANSGSKRTAAERAGIAYVRSLTSKDCGAAKGALSAATLATMQDIARGVDLDAKLCGNVGRGVDFAGDVEDATTLLKGKERAVVRVDTKAGEATHRVDLLMVKEGGDWKVDLDNDVLGRAFVSTLVVR